MMSQGTLQRVAGLVIERYSVESAPFLHARQPYELLISTVISQATERRNTERAVEALRGIGALSYAGLKKLDRSELEDALRPSGLFRQRAESLSRINDRLGQSGLAEIMTMPLAAARKALMALPGVGPKTADVFLAFTRSGEVFPVDVHISRILKRLPIAGPKAGYEELRATVEKAIGKQDRNAFHVSLIELGRDSCRPMPRCHECVLETLCSKAGVPGADG